MVWGYLTAAVLTMAGYLIFIPKYGYWGAAWMTVFSEVIAAIWTAVIVYRAIHFFPRLKTFLKTIPAAIIMTGVLYAVRDWHVLILLVVAGVVYFVFLYLFKGIKKETIQGLLRLK